MLLCLRHFIFNSNLCYWFLQNNSTLIMSKRPRTEASNDQEDIWGDDFTCDEVNSIDNIETLASQPHFTGK